MKSLLTHIVSLFAIAFFHIPSANINFQAPQSLKEVRSSVRYLGMSEMPV